MGTRHLYWIVTGPSFAVCLKVFVRNNALGDPMTFIEICGIPQIYVCVIQRKAIFRAAKLCKICVKGDA
jgi:hypothetical protein